MGTVDLPLWAQYAFDDKISNGAYYEHGGNYVFTVERENCDRFECNIEVWIGTIDAAIYDANYNGQPDPTKQNAELSWRDLAISQL